MACICLLISGSGIGAASLSAQNATGQTSRSPNEQRHPDGRTNQGRDGAKDPTLRVSLIEQPDQTARRQAAEEAAREKERNDRETQQFNQGLGFFQAALSALAFIGACIALFYTARAANAAAKSVLHAKDALDHSATSAGAAVRGAEAAEGALSLAREALRHSATSADAAMRGAHAAENALSAMRAQNTFERRPYIYASPNYRKLEYVADPEGDGSFNERFCELSARIDNFGRGPAYALKMHSAVAVFRPNQEPTYKEPDWDRLIEMIIIPKQHAEAKIASLEKSAYEQVRRKEIRLFWQVQVRYNDGDGASYETAQQWELKAHAPFDALMEDDYSTIEFVPVRGAVMT